jgi:hypothetical protein
MRLSYQRQTVTGLSKPAAARVELMLTLSRY